MKLILVLSIIGIILFTFQVKAEIDPNTIVGIWLLDEGAGTTVRDGSGNGHDGEIVGDIKWTQGKFGKALEFPGESGNMVEIPSHPNLNLMNFTILACYKGEATDSWQYLISKEIPHNTRNYSLGVQKDSGKLMVQFTVGAQSWKTATGSTLLTDESWHHLAGTYDGEFIRGWVDGLVEAETAEVGEPDNVDDRPLTIGAVNGIPAKGIIDDIALFNVALQEEDINEIMTEGLSETLEIFAISPHESLSCMWSTLKSK